MQYLYHIVPPDLQGDTLYPLNRFKESHPELYGKKASKYVGREKLMEQRIPILGCLWNDVIHLTAVNPADIRGALIAAGHTDVPHRSYYQIDPHLLEPENTVVYLYAHKDETDHWAGSNFAVYAPDDIEKYAVMPQATKEYYKKMLDQGKWPLLFHRVPHILYRGSLNVTDLPTVTA